MGLNISKLKKKVNKIISSDNLGSTLYVHVYNLGEKDKYGNQIKTLDYTITSSGAKISSTGNTLNTNTKQEELTLLTSYDLDTKPEEGKLKLYEFMNKIYKLDNDNPINGIQNSGAGNELKLVLYKEK